jgi:hypothetical protein
MSTSVLLIVPFPPAKSPQSSSTPSPTADLSVFVQYIQSLESSNSPSQWAHPFHPSQIVASTEPQAEICGTLWNFIARLHVAIREIEVGDVERLRSIRRLIEDCVAAEKNFTFSARQFQHPFFTPELGRFIEKYNLYIAAVWQLECGICAGKSDPASVAQWSAPCLQSLKECDMALAKVDFESQKGLRKVIAGLTVYFTGLVQLKLGEAQVGIEKGDALAHYRAAAAVFDGIVIDHSDTFFRMTLEHLRQQTVSARDDLESRHRKIHFLHVPATPPAAPGGPPVPRIAANRELLFAGVDPEEPAPPRPSPTQTGVTAGGSQQFASHSGAPPPFPQAGGPPPFPQAGGPPPFSPSGGTHLQYRPPSGPPPFYPGAGKPPQFVPPGAPQPQFRPPSGSPQVPPLPYGPAPTSGPVNGFPEWDALKALKAQVHAKLRALLASPISSISGKAKQFEGPVAAAADADRLVEENINTFLAGTKNFTREDVLQAIQQSQTFYTALETRLNQLEAQGS